MNNTINSLEDFLQSLNYKEIFTGSLADEMKNYGNRTFLLKPDDNSSLFVWIYISFPSNFPKNKVITITKKVEGSYDNYKQQMNFSVDTVWEIAVILRAVSQ